jgi:antitoxin ParD1/3/4
VEALLGQAPNQTNDDEFDLLADRLADEFASCFDSNVPMLSDDALSRESIYGEHP